MQKDLLMKEKKNKVAPSVETPVFMEQLDEVFLHKIRLAACVLLTRQDALSFTLLKKALLATDGNLGAQLRKLEEVGYVTMKKEFHDRKPVTWYTMTKKGKEALALHLDGITSVLQQVNGVIPDGILSIKDAVIPIKPAQKEESKPGKTASKKEFVVPVKTVPVEETFHPAIPAVKEEETPAEVASTSEEVLSVESEDMEAMVSTEESLAPEELDTQQEESCLEEPDMIEEFLSKPGTVEEEFIENIDSEEEVISEEPLHESIDEPIMAEEHIDTEDNKEEIKERKKEKTKEESKPKKEKEVKDTGPSLFDF